MMPAKAAVAATFALVVSASVPLLELQGSHWIEPVTGMRFVLLPSGTFTMGSSPDERWRELQETPHEVMVSRRVFRYTHGSAGRGFSLGFRVVREPRSDRP